MNTLELHQINAVNKALTILPDGEPEPSGAHDYYTVCVDKAGGPEWVIQFHTGDPDKVGINGLTHEALLVILIHRLEGFQTGPFACPDNALAIENLKVALSILQRRTRERMARGVEGTQTP